MAPTRVRNVALRCREVEERTDREKKSGRIRVMREKEETGPFQAITILKKLRLEQ